jgi:hypothetical protein
MVNLISAIETGRDLWERPDNRAVSQLDRLILIPIRILTEGTHSTEDELYRDTTPCLSFEHVARRNNHRMATDKGIHTNGFYNPLPEVIPTMPE